MKFTRENQGASTYLVYQIEQSDQIDTLSLGMIINNKITGIAPTIYNQLDDKKFLKYNISAKVPLKQYFMGTVNRQQLLKVFKCVLEGLSAAEDYMLELSTILLDLNYIFVDVSTSETVLICIPVALGQENTLDIKMFFKTIMFNTQFEQMENGDYIAKIIGYLNSASQLSLIDFKQIIEKLLNEGTQQTNVQHVNIPQQTLQAKEQLQPIAEQVQQSGAQNKNVAQKAAAVQKKSVPQPDIGFAIPGNVNIPTETKNKKEKKQKGKKEKPKNDKKGFSLFGKKKTESAIEFSVPGTENSVQQGVNNGMKPGQIPKVEEVQPVVPPRNAPVAPPVQTSQNTGRYADVLIKGANFGETTVLGNGASGETVVLSNVASQGSLQPYLTRMKNKEQIVINKPIFRIGKERSYVDYFIGDNPAISRSHANIITRDDGYYIEDTNSTNHTYVNGQLIVSGSQVKLERNTQICLGNEEFLFNY